MPQGSEKFWEDYYTIHIPVGEMNRRRNELLGLLRSQLLAATIAIQHCYDKLTVPTPLHY